MAIDSAGVHGLQTHSRYSTSIGNPLEIYVTENTDSVVSHGLCQECARNLYGEFIE